MKRFRQWLFGYLAMVSLLCAATTLVVFVRSYSVVDRFSHVGISSWQIYGSDAGKLFVSVNDVPHPEKRQSRWSYRQYNHSHYPQDYVWSSYVEESDWHWQHLGFIVTANHQNGKMPEAGFSITVPYLFIFVLTVATPVILIASFFRRRLKIMKGQCSICGYDLRATPDRCPECGTIPSAS